MIFLNQPAFSPSSVKPADPSSTKLRTFERKTASEPAKVNLHTQCYGCFTNQCPSQTKILLVEVPIKEEEDGLEVIVYQQDDDSDASAENCEFNGCIRTLH